MRLLAFSDLHLDAVTAGRARRPEVLEYLRDAHAVATSFLPDVVVFSGDAFDPGGLQDCMNSSCMIAALLGFAQRSTVIAIAGNHDVIDTSALFEGYPVTTLTPVRAAARFMPEVQAARLHVVERPRFLRVDDGWGVLALPYVSRVHLGSLPGWMDEAFDDASAFGDSIVVVGHLVIPGAAMGSESIEMARGQDQLFPFERVAALKPKLVINGHYHGRQEVLAPNDLRIHIPGAPLRFTFGEVADVEKGFLTAVL